MQYNSYTEWDPLRSMMVADINVDNQDIQSDIFALKGKHLSTLVEKTKKMLDTLSDTLSDQGVEIIRPTPKNFTGKHRFPCLNIRDRLGVVGKKLLQYSHGEDYKSLPACYDLPVNFTFPRFSNHMIWNGEQMMNDVPYLEGANLIRCGNIIFCTIEDTGNDLGIDVLQNVIGDEYKQFILKNESVVDFEYPNINFPVKVKSLDLLKVNRIKARLIAIKGQYLLFDDNTVLNIRKHTGFKISLQAN